MGVHFLFFFPLDRYLRFFIFKYSGTQMGLTWKIYWPISENEEQQENKEIPFECSKNFQIPRNQNPFPLCDWSLNQNLGNHKCSKDIITKLSFFNFVFSETKQALILTKKKKNAYSNLSSQNRERPRKQNKRMVQYRKRLTSWRWEYGQGRYQNLGFW